jgi:hypothetical protein
MMIPKIGQAQLITGLQDIIIPGGGGPGSGRGNILTVRKNSFQKFRKSKKKIG